MAVYSKIVLNRPWLTLLILALIFASLGYHIKDFRLDASSDSLILENDKDLKFFKEINKKYGTNDFLLMAYKPKQGELFSKNVLSNLEKLRDELKKIKNVDSVISILDVPLLENPPVPIKDLVTNIKTLGSNDTNLDMARAEFRESPIYQELLVSSDLSITALQINFKKNDEFEKISSQRSRLREKQNIDSITPKEKTELDQLEIKYKKEKIRLDGERHREIALIRTLMKNHKNKAELFLGGTSMISDDMITFVKNDIKIFGTGMFLFLTLTLGVIFKEKRWVFLPIICCIFSIISMTGLIGIFGWEITVISSNFISLQLIVTMALTIHLIVRYRELVVQNPKWSQFDLVKQTIASKFIPCLFTTLTTIAGFSSLLVCDILPVINFGWMMSIGMIVSLVVIFLLFPVILVLLPINAKGSEKQFGKKITDLLAHVTEKHAKSIYLVTGLLIIITVTGISKLTVENSFIDYFKKSTEIYRGMKVIDQTMGGTTPLDVIINFQAETFDGDTEGLDSGFDGFDGFNEFEEEEEDSDKYWFTADKMALIKKIHNYLENQKEIGKVLSLGTMMKIAEKFNNGKPLDNFELAMLYTKLPDEFKKTILSPYVSVKDNQARISVRIKDSLENLKRDQLLKKIESDIEKKFKLKGDEVQLAGIMVLYNNMLQSLFSSQILSMGFVVIAMLIMLMIIFRSLKIALIALFPNLLSSIVVLAAMGLTGRPLDMMTITIAAISIGIAVDDTIHYIHRFKEEFQTDHNYTAAMHRCHNSIGNAVVYTSLTIIMGFSILVFSNFIPTVLFGFLIGLAMIIALIAALSLLPRLIMDFKPF